MMMVGVLSYSVLVLTIHCVYPSVLTFGFEPTEYSVNEGDGSVDLGIFISGNAGEFVPHVICLLYTSPSPRDATLSRMPSSA